MSKRVVGYSRVSSEEQLDGYSLSAQAEAMQRFADQRGWELVHIYEERGRSGKTIYRPEFQQMLRDAEAGLFDVIVVHKLDRFSRSLLDMLTCLKQLNEMNVSLVSVTEDFDFTTPFGKLILAVLASFAEWYLDNLRTEVIKGKRERVRQGFWNGTLSWGYSTRRRLRTRLMALGEDFKSGAISEDDYSRLADIIEDALGQYADRQETAAIPCPFNAEGVRRAFSWYSTGSYSLGDIAEMLARDGFTIEGRKGNTYVTKDTVEDVLQNRFYLGETSYGKRVPGKKRVWMAGNHPPLVSPALYERVQVVRAERAEHYIRGSHGPKTVYPLSSLIVCAECGSFWQGNYDNEERRYRDPAKQKRRQCRQKIKSATAVELEGQIEEMLQEITLPSDWREQILAQVTPTQDASPEAVQVAYQRRKTLESRLDRLKKLYVMGDIKEAEYQKMKDELAAQMDASPVIAGVSMVDLQYATELLGDFGTIIAEATPSEKKELFRALFKRIYILGGEIKAIEPTPVMWVLLNSVCRSEAGRTGFEPALLRLAVPVNTTRKSLFKNAA